MAHGRHIESHTGRSQDVDVEISDRCIDTRLEMCAGETISSKRTAGAMSDCESGKDTSATPNHYEMFIKGTSKDKSY